MKVLALDYGAARTGVAISDATGTLARPLTVGTEEARNVPDLRNLPTDSPEDPFFLACAF